MKNKLVLCACVSILFPALPVVAADSLITPSLTIQEEYTDNVFESSSNKRYDFITRAMPGLALKYEAPIWTWDIGYNFDYRYYARNSRSDDTTHNLNGRGHVTLIDNLLFLDISDTYRRVSLDVTRDTSQESLFANQSDQNVFSASPYFQLKPTERTTFKAGYRYGNTWYKEARGVDKFEHNGFVDLGYEFSPSLTANVGYLYTKLDSTTNDYQKHNSYLGLRYEYADKSYLFGQGGADNISYGNGSRYTNPFWNAGLSHTFDRIAVQLGTGVKYADDPLRESIQETSYTGAFTYLLQRGSAGFSLGYTEYVATGTDTLEHRKFSGGVNCAYEILPNVNGTLGFNAEKYDNVPLSTYTRKFYVDSSISYSFPDDLSIRLLYKHIDYYSPDIASDNKVTNRIVIEARKSF